MNQYNIAEAERLYSLTEYERSLWQQGLSIVAGLDEAGRGPLAGPVVAAAVILSPGSLELADLNDSKKLTEQKRKILEIKIKKTALSYAVASASPQEIDDINILQATKLAMQRAVAKLNNRPEHLLIDALKLEQLDIPQTPIIKGDSLSASIAAASILAKCARDKLMVSFDKLYPQYGFAKHKGYPTPEHYQLLKIFGPCPIHRKTFRLI